jgi:hypothetical protein
MTEHDRRGLLDMIKRLDYDRGPGPAEPVPAG